MNQTTDLFLCNHRLIGPIILQDNGASVLVNPISTATCPNQDGIYLQKTENGMVAVVCDGAGSGKI